MADEDVEETTDEQTEVEEKPSKTDDNEIKKLLEDVRSENAQLRGAVQTSTQAAGEARQYVGALLAKIQEVAAKRQVVNDGDTRKDQFDEDPEAAVNQMFNERVAPIVSEYMTNTARANKIAAAKELGENWTRYEREIEEFMATMPLDVQAKPGAWESAYRYILAGHLDEELERRNKVKQERKAAAEGSSGREASRRDAPLDPTEREVMKAFGLTEKEWREFASDEIERTPPARDRKSVFAGKET